ncbi:leucyl aminopeptidase [Constrictibacter sp. MBR-5]|uniref:leucyl aminopeptidase family protein n=1 Tax=Constrictibacter sp. MBR-5 TaxID=3156467 RepID=UPI0033934642
MSDFLTGRSSSAIPLTVVTSGQYDGWLEAQPAGVRAWLDASAFKGKPGSVVRIPDAERGVSQVVVGVEDPASPWSYGDLPARLEKGTYRLDRDLSAHAATQATIGWGLGTYAFDRYKRRDKAFATLVWPEQADRDHALRTIEAVFLARDLINTPANDLGPAELEDAARALAKKHKAKFNTIVGDDLLKQNYPTIHMVGRGSVRAPRLIDIRWGKAGAPRVTLVGKGVCFDTGGYDLKPSSGMLNMKKDMGGAANILGLAHMVMAAKLPVRLRVLIPAVENSVSGNAMRPRDIVKTRKGLTVEIGNTDAEGRLVLCDALADADDEKPDLVIDCATLTGAARVALGQDLPALFCNDDDFAAGLTAHGGSEADPMWRLPLWDGYRKNLDSDIADMNNVSEGGFGGAITAALYLQAFVSKETKWAHVDMFAWNQGNRPGRPKGGEAQFIRAAFGYLRERYA